MTEKQHKRCPFCGGKGNEAGIIGVGGLKAWKIMCSTCSANTGQLHGTKAEAWREWDKRYGEGERCATCRHYVVGGKVDYCALIRYARNTDDYCSRWEEA